MCQKNYNNKLFVSRGNDGTNKFKIPTIENMYRIRGEYIRAKVVKGRRVSLPALSKSVLGCKTLHDIYILARVARAEIVKKR